MLATAYQINGQIKEAVCQPKCTVERPEERMNGACLSKRQDVVYLYTPQSLDLLS
jgi:hypothetical protein